MMTKLLSNFIIEVKDIAAKCTYRQPGKGDDGTSDCIGAIIGGLERVGLKWQGIHGTNYGVRYQSVEFRPISSANQLSVGDVVYKGYPEGESGWNLPKRYNNGGEYYNGDLTDYYHVGLVTSVNPLNITHMTSPSGKTDTKLGKWGYFCKLKPLIMAGAYDENDDDDIQHDTSQYISGDTSETENTEPVSMTVYSENGKPVNMRKSANLKGELIARVPVGETVEVIWDRNDWCKIKWDNKTGYMMSTFLRTASEAEEIKSHPDAGAYATVVPETGEYVKLRQSPSTKCRIYDNVPGGSIVQIIEPGEVWAKVDYGRRHGWYMMAKYLQVNG